MGLPIRLGKNKRRLIRISSPVLQDPVRHLYDTLRVLRFQPDNGHGPLHDPCLHILKSLYRNLLLHRRFCHGKFVISALKMVMTQDRSAHNRKIRIGSHEIMRELLHKVKQLTKRISVDLHGNMLPIKYNAMLVIVDIGRILKSPCISLYRDRNNSVILPRRMINSARISFVLGGDTSARGIAVAQAVAIPLAVAGLFLTMLVRTVSVGLVHGADAAAKEGDIAKMERYHYIALLLQGLRIAVPAALLLAIPTQAVQAALEAMPAWLSNGMAIGGGMVVAVGYAMVINMMATREVWPFFAIGFALAAVSDLTLIALGAIGVALAFIYLNLSKKGGSGGGSAATSTDPIGDILEDY